MEEEDKERERKVPPSLEKLVTIVKLEGKVKFFNLEKKELRNEDEVFRILFKYLSGQKRDCEAVLSLMSEKAYNRANMLLEAESNRTGMDYSI